MTTSVGPRKIAVGDLGEFWYGNYKEPFAQLEGAVEGYPQGAVLKDDDGRLLCAYCGKTFKFLPRHITSAHRMTTAQYKDNVGLLQKSALVDESIRQSRIRTGLRNRADGKFMDRPTRAMVLRSVESRKASGRGNFPVEKQNMTGRCYAQILAVARQVMRERGRVTIKDMTARGIWQSNVEQMFGSMTNLSRLVGDGRRNSGNRWTDAELIGALRSLGQSLGRTPAISDLKRYGMPPFQMYIKRFGSYMTACERADLTPYQLVPRDPQSEAAMLMAWATTGDVKKAAAVVGHSDWAVRSTLDKYGIPKMPPGGGHHAQRQAARAVAADIATRLEGHEAAA